MGCDTNCFFQYAVKIHMQSHQKTNHSLKHACDICGATYARGFALKDHIKEQHGGVGDEMAQVSVVFYYKISFGESTVS